MKYFLVAPVEGAGTTPPPPPVTASDGSRSRILGTGVAVRSRLDHRQSELHQEWRGVSPERLARAAPAGFRIEAAWLVASRSESVLAALVDHTDAANAPLDVLTIEAALSDVAAAILRSSDAPADAQLLWVNRTVLLPNDAAVPAQWNDASIVTAELVASSTEPPILADFGWGNNAVRGWPPGDDAMAQQILMGLVDAQTVWREIEALSAESARIVHNVVDRDSVARRRGYQSTLDDLQKLSAGMAAHHLAYDDVLLSIQGARRAAARASLSAWNYDEVAERVGRRISDIAAVIRQRKDALDRTYQGLVGAIGVVLSLVVFIDLLLSFISTSFSGVDAVPGTGSPLGVLSWFRSVETDWLFAATAGVILLVIGLLALSRRARRAV